MPESMLGWARVGAVGALFTAFFLLTACDEVDGPAEKAGKKVDEAVEKAGDKVEDAPD